MEEVLKELRGGRRAKYDTDVVDAMLELIECREFDLDEKRKFEEPSYKSSNALTISVKLLKGLHSRLFFLQ